VRSRAARHLCSLVLCASMLLCAAAVPAQRKSERDITAPKSSMGRVMLVPIDDRPATTQFAELIGRIADVDVIMPPRELLGVFTAGGKPEQIAAWLRRQDYRDVDALILSSDMLAYGGLMTSRTSATSLDAAQRRLDVIKDLRHAHPQLPVYAFSVVQRVALSATAANRSYRDKLARWVVLADETTHTNDAKLKAEHENLQRELPSALIKDYLATRARNLQINYAMLELAHSGTINRLLLLQDDAHPYGLHRRDQATLRERMGALHLSTEQATLYDGADEGSNVLLSQAILRKHNFAPHVRVIYSSAAGRKHIGAFEDQTIETSVERQLENSGALPADDTAQADYTLYVSAPEQTESDFKAFLATLIADIKSGKHVAIADVLFKVWGGGDSRLIEALAREHLLDRVIGYASWGTPGNTLGTVIPQANFYTLARHKLFDDPQRAEHSENAEANFTLHRYVEDYGYQAIVRRAVNDYTRRELKIEVEEFDQPTYKRINEIVATRMTAFIDQFFAENFRNRCHDVGVIAKSPRTVCIENMSNLKVRLPWMRSFEVRVDFDLKDTLLQEYPSAKRKARKKNL